VQHRRRLADSSGAVHDRDPGGAGHGVWLQQGIQRGKGVGAATEHRVRRREHAGRSRRHTAGLVRSVGEKPPVHRLRFLARPGVELLVQHAVQVPVGGERVGTSAGRVEHGHEADPQALAERMGADELAQPGGQVTEPRDVPREREVCAPFHGVERELQQPWTVHREEQVGVDRLEGRAVPVPECPLEQVMLLGRVVCGAASGEGGLEPVEVDGVGRNSELVAAGSGADRAGAQHCSQPGHQHLGRLAGVRRAPVAPHRGGDALRRHGAADVQSEHGEQRARPRAQRDR
jgi:hypothetical protein